MSVFKIAPDPNIYICFKRQNLKLVENFQKDKSACAAVYTSSGEQNWRYLNQRESGFDDGNDDDDDDDDCDDDAKNGAPSPMLDKQLVLGHPQGAALVPANIVSINKAGKVSRDIIIF